MFAQEAAENSMTRHRRLSGGEPSSIECHLSLDIMELVWDGDHGTFYLETQDINNATEKLKKEQQSPIAESAKHAHLRRWHRQLHVGQSLSANETSSRVTTAVKACWCLQALNRPVEYCPAHFDSCKVQAPAAAISWRSSNNAADDDDDDDRPVLVSCHYASQAATFLSGFWLLFIFWLVALILLLIFSDVGASAREYAGRKLHLFRRRMLLCSCNSNSRGHDNDAAAIEDALLQANLEHLLVHNEERAGILFQNAMAREHERRRRLELAARQEQSTNLNHHHHHHMSSIWRRQTTTAASPSAAALDEVNASNNDSFPKLLLKTKVFQSEKANEDDAADHSEKNGVSSLSISSTSSPPPTSLTSCFTFPTSIVATTDDGIMSHHQQQSEEQEDCSKLCCAICLVGLQQGDVVGDIPCGHVFHKQCLKDWLQQKCKCPLCQRTDVATTMTTNTTKVLANGNININRLGDRPTEQYQQQQQHRLH